MNWISYLLAIGGGAANPAGANAELNKSLQNPLWATTAVYSIGLPGLLLIAASVCSAFPSMQKVSSAPWWAWIGGLLSIASTMTGVTFAQRMGSGVFTGLTVTASLVNSMMLDNFGLMGFKLHPMSLWRSLGTALMITGLWLIAEF